MDKFIIQDLSETINPKHYQIGKFQAFDFAAEACKHLPGDEAICAFNILKYVIRYSKKNGIEDLKKSEWYLNKLIELMENKNHKLYYVTNFIQIITITIKKEII